jgi:hypothetical protein
MIDPLAPVPKVENQSSASMPRWGQAAIGAVSAVAVAASNVIPQPWGKIVEILGFIFSAIAGLGGSVPKMTANKPIVQGAAVAVAGTTAAGLAAASEALPDGPVKTAVQGGALLGFWLAGKQATFKTQGVTK